MAKFGPLRATNTQIIAAIKETGGVTTLIALQLGSSRAKIEHRIKTSRELRAALRETLARIEDTAKGTVLAEVKRAQDPAFARAYLRDLERSRAVAKEPDPPAPRPRGANRKPQIPYSEKLADEIVRILTEGTPLTVWCAEDRHRPSFQSVMNWADQNEEFNRRYRAARERAGDHHADRVAELAEDAARRAVDSNAARVAIDAYKWLAGIRQPKKYAPRPAEVVPERDDAIAFAGRIRAAVSAMTASVPSPVTASPETPKEGTTA